MFNDFRGRVENWPETWTRMELLGLAYYGYSLLYRCTPSSRPSRRQRAMNLILHLLAATIDGSPALQAVCSKSGLTPPSLEEIRKLPADPAVTSVQAVQQACGSGSTVEIESAWHLAAGKGWDWR